MRASDRAICLRTIDYSETSQVVFFLTRCHGAVRLLAKGTKRPKSKSGGAIDLLSEGELVFSTGKEAGDALGTLMEFCETVVHSPLRREACRLHAALYALELAGEMLPLGDPHPEVFDLLHNALARLGQSDAPVAAVLAYFQWRFLRRVGLLGEMRSCASCGRPIDRADELHFSSRQGGLLCGDCEGAQVEKYRVDADTLASLRTIQAAEAGTKVSLTAPQALALNRLLAYHVAEQLGKVLKMARHVCSLSRSG